jgi:hypothetical protein
VLVQTDAHERLTLPATAPMAPHIGWEQDPGFEPIFIPVLGRIRILAENGLTSMMVLHDYVSKRIAPLQERTRLAWLYTRVNDVTWLECGDGPTVGEEALALMMGKLSPDLSSHDFVTPPASCQPLYMDQAARTLLLVVMPSMNEVNIVAIQRGDQSCGVQIPGQASQVARVMLPPLWPLARERGWWCELSTTTMKYHLTMMFHCRGR